MSKPEMVPLGPPEKRREYHWGDGTKAVFENVVRLAVSPSGTHRLETADGLKHIVPVGWRYITLDVEEWTL